MVFRQGACCYSAAVAVVAAHGDSIELFPVRADPCCAASFVCCMLRSIETMLSAMAPCMWCFAVLRRLKLTGVDCAERKRLVSRSQQRSAIG